MFYWRLLFFSHVEHSLTLVQFDLSLLLIEQNVPRRSVCSTVYFHCFIEQNIEHSLTVDKFDLLLLFQNKVYQEDKLVLRLALSVLFNRTIFTLQKLCSTADFNYFILQNNLLLWLSLFYCQSPSLKHTFLYELCAISSCLCADKAADGQNKLQPPC